LSVIANITEWLLNISRICVLEIGSSILRFADGELRQSVATIKEYKSCRNPVTNFNAANDSINYDNLSDSLKSLAGMRYGIERYAAIIIPDHLFHFGSVSLPVAAGKAGILPIIQRDIQTNAPLPFNAYSIRHESGKTRNGKLNIQYCALPLNTQSEIERACNRARILPVSIQPSFACLHKLLHQHQNISEHAYVFLHIGNQNTSMGIYDQNGLRAVFVINFGVQTLISAIVQNTDSDEASAVHQLFNEPLLLDDPADSKAQREIPAFALIEGLIADFLQQVYGQLLLFNSENPEETGYSSIIISGGGALIKNFDRLVAYNLGISSVKLSDELEHVRLATAMPEAESLETIAPLLGNLSLQPVNRNRFDRVMAA
jgi:Tfp pilus assembly PilM family ATPase